MVIKLYAFILPMILIFAAPSFAGWNEEKVEWSQVPAKVQETITEHAQGGEILEVEKEKKKKVITVYEAEVRKPDGKKIEIKVEEDGTLIEIEED